MDYMKKEDLWSRIPAELRREGGHVSRRLSSDDSRRQILGFVKSYEHPIHRGSQNNAAGGVGDKRIRLPKVSHNRKIWEPPFGFAYILKGQVDFFRTGEQDGLTVRAGEVVISGGAPHPHLPKASHVPGTQEIYLHVDSVTGRHLRELGLWTFGNEVVRTGHSIELLDMFLHLFHSMKNGPGDSGSWLRDFVNIVARIASLRDQNLADVGFQKRALEGLTSRMQRARAIEETAQDLGMSSRSFRRVFREEMGKSPRDALLAARMERAAELLSLHLVKEVAEEVGYSDPFIFSRQFKRYFGKSPTEFAAGGSTKPFV